MNKIRYAAVATAAATVALLGATSARAQQPINVTVDGDVVAFGAQQPIEQFGSVLVPLRGVFEKLGATVAYDGGTRSILAVRGPTTVSLKLGSRDATVNNQARTLSVPAQAVNGATLVPLRFVSEALGAQVRWQADSRTVIVTSTGGGASGNAGNTTPPPPRTGGEARNDYRYGRINVRWDFKDLTVRDRAGLEARIRRELNTDAGSPRVNRRPTSSGVLDVNVTLSRMNFNTVRSDVRLGLNPGGGEGTTVTATESATTPSRNDTVDGQVVLQALRKARREFGAKVDQYARNQRRTNQ